MTSFHWDEVRRLRKAPRLPPRPKDRSPLPSLRPRLPNPPSVRVHKERITLPKLKFMDDR